MAVADVARDGIDAIAKLADHRYDISFLDLEMPNMDGLSCLERMMIKEPVPVVVLSCYMESRNHVIFDVLEAGALTSLPRCSATREIQYK